MNLLRFYFMVGGEDFDAEKFSLAAIRNGLECGIHRTTNNTKKLTSGVTGNKVEIKILSGITGTSGESYATWQTAPEIYATDKDVYLARQNLGLTTEAAQIWLREEDAILKFLQMVKDRIPSVADFCKGEYFMLLKLVYGYDETSNPGGGDHYSEVLMRNICNLNAGLSIDSEAFELHFLNCVVTP